MLPSRRMKAAHGNIIAAVGEVDRAQEYRDEGATSTESWLVGRYGVSTATARLLTQVGKKAWDIPHLVGSLCEGEISFDKVRVLADVATPETEGELCDQAKGCSVRELADIARSEAELAASRSPSSSARSEHDRRFVRFNDSYRTISAQLAPDAYAETKAAIDAQLQQIPSEGETPLDQRRCDALVGIVALLRRGSRSRPPRPAPLSWWPTSPWPPWSTTQARRAPWPASSSTGVSSMLETVRRIACDATVVVALDDDLGHTMYEGRAKRSPSDAQRREVMRRDRHCRFPGCTNVTFTNVHHIVPWKPGGRTDPTTWPCSASFTTKRCTPRAGRCRAMPLQSSPSAARAAGS